MDDDESFDAVIADKLARCLAEGFTLPLTMMMVSVDGCVVAVRYTAGDSSLKPQVLTVHTERGRAWRPPINIMISDAVGEASLVVIDILPDVQGSRH